MAKKKLVKKQKASIIGDTVQISVNIRPSKDFNGLGMECGLTAKVIDGDMMDAMEQVRSIVDDFVEEHAQSILGDLWDHVNKFKDAAKGKSKPSRFAK